MREVGASQRPGARAGRRGRATREGGASQRPGGDEASALLVGLRMLAEVAHAAAEPGPADRSALSRTIAKLEAAAGEAAAPSAQVAIQVDQVAERAVLATVTDALGRGRRLHLSYYLPRRHEATEPDVDPMRLLVVEGRTYLEGWCRRAEAVRLFRLDRVLGIDVLEGAAEVPADAKPVDVDQGVFRPSAGDLNVVIDLSVYGRWVAEYYPCENVTELGDGRLRVTLRTPDAGWVRRLALRLGENGRILEPADIAPASPPHAAPPLPHYTHVPH